MANIGKPDGEKSPDREKKAPLRSVKKKEGHNNRNDQKSTPRDKSPVGRWGEREAGILAVALDLFNKEGYENCSMARVAAAANLSEGTLYNYFRDKNDLLVRVAQVDLESRVTAAVQIVDESHSLREGLQDLIALHLGTIIDNAEIYRIWVREVRASAAFHRSVDRNTLARFANQFGRLLEKFGYIQKLPAGLSLQFMREVVFGGSEHIGFTALLQRRAKSLDVRDTAAKLADVYLRGFELEKKPAAKRKSSKRLPTSAA